jgi:hypothetical protein
LVAHLVEGIVQLRLVAEAVGGGSVEAELQRYRLSPAPQVTGFPHFAETAYAEQFDQFPVSVERLVAGLELAAALRQQRQKVSGRARDSDAARRGQTRLPGRRSDWRMLPGICSR